MPTHEVLNQVPPLTGTDISTHAALIEGLQREGAGVVRAREHVDDAWLERL